MQVALLKWALSIFRHDPVVGLLWTQQVGPEGIGKFFFRQHVAVGIDVQPLA